MYKKRQELLWQHSDRYAAEYRIRNKNNQYIYVLAQGIVVQRDADGNPVRLVGSTTDISDRKQAEAAIQASEERLRSFVKANIVGILFGDVNGSITEANDEFLRIVGYTQEDIQADRLRWADITSSCSGTRSVNGFVTATERRINPS